ncbi:MAG: hypothetical protein ACOYT4_02510 [Nanoarchaeota archaeon]
MEKLTQYLSQDMSMNRRNFSKFFGLSLLSLGLSPLLGCGTKTSRFKSCEEPNSPANEDLDIGTIIAKNPDDYVDKQYIKDFFLEQRVISSFNTKLIDLLNETHFNFYRERIPENLRIFYYSNFKEIKQYLPENYDFEEDESGIFYKNVIFIKKNLTAVENFLEISHHLGHAIDDKNRGDFFSSIIEARESFEIYNSFPDIGDCLDEICEPTLYWQKDSNPFMCYVNKLLLDLKSIKFEEETIQARIASSNLILNQLAEGYSFYEIQKYVEDKDNTQDILYSEISKNRNLTNSGQTKLANQAIDTLMIDVNNLPYSQQLLKLIDDKLRLYVKNIFNRT